MAAVCMAAAPVGTVVGALVVAVVVDEEPVREVPGVMVAVVETLPPVCVETALAADFVVVTMGVGSPSPVMVMPLMTVVTVGKYCGVLDEVKVRGRPVVPAAWLTLLTALLSWDWMLEPMDAASDWMLAYAALRAVPVAAVATAACCERTHELRLCTPAWYALAAALICEAAGLGIWSKVWAVAAPARAMMVDDFIVKGSE